MWEEKSASVWHHHRRTFGELHNFVCIYIRQCNALIGPNNATLICMLQFVWHATPLPSLLVNGYIKNCDTKEAHTTTPVAPHCHLREWRQIKFTFADLSCSVSAQCTLPFSFNVKWIHIIINVNNDRMKSALPCTSYNTAMDLIPANAIFWHL